jgi:hypothetical protein
MTEHAIPTIEQFRRAAKLTDNSELKKLVEFMEQPNAAAYMLLDELCRPDPYRDAEAAANRHGDYDLADAMGRWADIRSEHWGFRQRERKAIAEGRTVSYDALQSVGVRWPLNGGVHDGKRYFLMSNCAGAFWEHA